MMFIITEHFWKHYIEWKMRYNNTNKIEFFSLLRMRGRIWAKMSSVFVSFYFVIAGAALGYDDGVNVALLFFYNILYPLLSHTQKKQQIYEYLYV